MAASGRISAAIGKASSQRRPIHYKASFSPTYGRAAKKMAQAADSGMQTTTKKEGRGDCKQPCARGVRDGDLGECLCSQIETGFPRNAREMNRAAAASAVVPRTSQQSVLEISDTVGSLRQSRARKLVISTLWHSNSKWSTLDTPLDYAVVVRGH